MNTPTSFSDEQAPASGGRQQRSRSARRAGIDQPLVTGLSTGEVCPLCRGAGYVVPDVPLGHPDFGLAVPCTCRQQERAQRRSQRLQQLSNLAPLRRLTFATFIAEPAHLAPERAYNLRRVYETCLEFAQEPEGWLLLTGTYGCGKTHLAAAIANQRLAQGEPALFMVVPDLLDHLRAAFSPASEVSYDELFDQLRTTPLLILDDLGTQSSTPWAQEKLFQLLNHRYNAHLPTLITTNQRLEDLDPRLRSRLADSALVQHCPIHAPDYRNDGSLGDDDLSTLRLHHDQTFSSFNPLRADIKGEERLNLQEVFAACQRYAADPDGWLVLIGTHGCGKTHLAAAIANYQVSQTLDYVMFVVVPDLLDHLRATFNPQANVPYDRLFSEIRNVPMLVLDDLGTESATAWAKEKLYQLLNYRYSARLSTVITTSTAKDKIEPWLRTRMFDVTRCQFCAILAPGYHGTRGQPAPKGRGRTTRTHL